jgi:hypothetical protein
MYIPNHGLLLTESVSTGRPERRSRLVFAFFMHPISLRHGLVAGWSGIMRCLSTGRSHVVRSILEPGHIRPLQASIIGRARCGCGNGFPAVFSFQRLQLSLALNFTFESGGSVGVDGLFGKVVSTTAGWGWNVVRLESAEKWSKRLSNSLEVGRSK